MSKKFGKELLKQLQTIRYKLDDMENCEDGEEMIHICQELSTDIESIEEMVDIKFQL